MWFRIEFLSRGSRSWSGAGRLSGEVGAIAHAVSVSRRPNVELVRVIDAKGIGCLCRLIRA